MENPVERLAQATEELTAAVKNLSALVPAMDRLTAIMAENVALREVELRTKEAGGQREAAQQAKPPDAWGTSSVALLMEQSDAANMADRMAVARQRADARGGPPAPMVHPLAPKK